MYLFRVFIVKLAFAVELIVEPLPFIGELVRLVEQPSIASHLIALPIPLIAPAILIVKSPLPMPHTVELEAIVATAFREFLIDLNSLAISANLWIAGHSLHAALLLTLP